MMKTALLLLTMLQSVDLFPVTKQEEKPATKESNRYLVVFTASWCGPCKTLKQNELVQLSDKSWKVKNSDHKVTVVDIDEQPQWGIGRVPAVWVVDRETRKPLKRMTGYKTADELLQELNSVAETPVKSGGQIYGRVGTSHESRATLIAHLITDGIHKGRHTQAELDAMTDEQLDALHNQEHNQSAGTPRNTRWTIQPRKVQTVRRRRGLFFEWGG